jgi:4-amino-4-deoxy-L-arabinose transferase-like glycosyltransferase
VFTVLFFSVSHSKLIPYVQPVFPALAVLAARRRRESPALGLDAAGAIAIGLLVAAVPVFPDEIIGSELPRSLLEGYRPFILCGAGILVLSGAAVLLRRGSGLRGAASLGGGALLAFQILLLGYQSLAQVHSARGLARAIDAEIGREAPVYSVNRYDQPLPFYLGRTVVLVHYRGELEYGLNEEPEKAIADLDTFQRVWLGQDQAAAVLSVADYRALSDQGLPMRAIYEDPRRVAVVRR